mgnify:CR=1 FL=1
MVWNRLALLQENDSALSTGRNAGAGKGAEREGTSEELESERELVHLSASLAAQGRLTHSCGRRRASTCSLPASSSRPPLTASSNPAPVHVPLELYRLGMLTAHRPSAPNARAHPRRPSPLPNPVPHARLPRAPHRARTRSDPPRRPLDSLHPRPRRRVPSAHDGRPSLGRWVRTRCHHRGVRSSSSPFSGYNG